MAARAESIFPVSPRATTRLRRQALATLDSSMATKSSGENGSNTISISSWKRAPGVFQIWKYTLTMMVLLYKYVSIAPCPVRLHCSPLPPTPHPPVVSAASPLSPAGDCPERMFENSVSALRQSSGCVRQMSLMIIKTPFTPSPTMAGIFFWSSFLLASSSPSSSLPEESPPPWEGETRELNVSHNWFWRTKWRMWEKTENAEALG